MNHIRSHNQPDDPPLIRVAQAILVAVCIGIPSLLVLALMSVAFGLWWAK